LFVDIVGSTSLAEGMDPEDWREIVEGAHRRVIEAVGRFEGTIAQLLGDGVLAFFGAPQAHEDDPERAIRAAILIQEDVGDYAGQIREKAPGFRVRVGIHTGLVVVGDVGDDEHLEYLAVGDTVNLAARLQGAAEPGSVLVSAETRRLAGPGFEYLDRGLLDLKGKDKPVRAFAVTAGRPGARRQRGIEGLSSPLVGRDQDLARLRGLLASLNAGRGGVAVVIGEAGLGKSRLIAEWRGAAQPMREEGLLWVETQCLSYGRALAFHLAAEILRGLIGATPDAGPEDTRLALDRACARLGPEAVEELVPALAHMLGLPLDEAPLSRIRFLDGDALHAKYAQAMQQLLVSLAAERPVVIVCDDMHWSDPSSVELGLHVLPDVVKAPILVALVSRPDEDSPGWRIVEQGRQLPGALEIELAPLTSEQSDVLIGHLLRSGEPPESLQRIISQRAEGNPFFVEEMLRMFIDRGLVRQDEGGWKHTGGMTTGEIPDTVQGVLTARIDRLPEDAKRVLQVAAVIGRQFSLRVLENALRALEIADEDGR
jgi:class 3 adenylate cyclase